MRHIAFLRGINVGGRRATGTQLCEPFGKLGFRQVVSFLASGNVTFGTEDVDDLEPRIEAALQEALGYPVESFVRAAGEVTEIMSREPFDAEIISRSGKPQVTFLRRAPAPAAVEVAMGHATEADRLAVAGREWYWLPSGGVSQSTLDVRAIERALGRGTTRTMNTVARLHARLQADSPR